jgi:hypothetical protein
MTALGVIGILAIIAGIATVVISLFWWLAGSESDAPAEGDAAGKSGLTTALVGVALIAFGIWGVW